MKRTDSLCRIHTHLDPWTSKLPHPSLHSAQRFVWTIVATIGRQLTHQPCQPSRESSEKADSDEDVVYLKTVQGKGVETDDDLDEDEDEDETRDTMLHWRKVKQEEEAARSVPEDSRTSSPVPLSPVPSPPSLPADDSPTFSFRKPLPKGLKFKRIPKAADEVPDPIQDASVLSSTVSPTTQGAAIDTDVPMSVQDAVMSSPIAPSATCEDTALAPANATSQLSKDMEQTVAAVFESTPDNLFIGRDLSILGDRDIPRTDLRYSWIRRVHRPGGHARTTQQAKPNGGELPVLTFVQ